MSEQSEYLNKQKSIPQEQIEIGRIEKTNYCDIVVTVDKFNNKKGISIREYLKMPTFTGFTSKGIRIPFEKYDELMSTLNKIQR